MTRPAALFYVFAVAICAAGTFSGCQTKGRDTARQAGQAPRSGVFRQTVTTPILPPAAFVPADLPQKRPAQPRQTAQESKSQPARVVTAPPAEAPGFSSRTESVEIPARVVTTEWETPEDAERPSSLIMQPDGSVRVEMGQTRKFTPPADMKAMQWGSVAIAGALILFGAWQVYRTWNWRGGVFIAAGFLVLVVAFTVQEYAIFYVAGLVALAGVVGWALTKGYRSKEKEIAADASK